MTCTTAASSRSPSACTASRRISPARAGSRLDRQRWEHAALSTGRNPSHCDGKSARTRISGLLDNSAAIASFGLPLEPLQRILYASLERLAAKCFEYPSPPTWRESEVSAKLHATGGGIDSCAADGCFVDGAEWKRDMQLDLMLFRIHHLDPERHIPLPAQPRGFRREHLPGRGFPLRHDALRARIPPYIIECWLREQFPYAFNWSCDNCCWADGEAHTFSSFERASNTPQ